MTLKMLGRCISCKGGGLRVILILGSCLLFVMIYMISTTRQPAEQTGGHLAASSRTRIFTASISGDADDGRTPGERQGQPNVKITHYAYGLGHNRSSLGQRMSRLAQEIRDNRAMEEESMQLKETPGPSDMFVIKGQPPGAFATPPTRNRVSGDRRRDNDVSVEESEEMADSDYGGYAKVDDLPPTRVDSVNCGMLFKGSESETLRATRYQYDHLVSEKEARRGSAIPWSTETKDCAVFRSKRGYITKPVSPEEEEFPLAFSMVIFKDPDQVERLLRAIYRPQNVYCIHVDKKASSEFMEAIASIVNCFPNVFLSSKSVDVHWGYFSVVEPDIICMDEVVKYKKWKYFINLTGQEFPLKTNLDIVKILKTFQGANDIAASPFSKMSKPIQERITHIYKEGSGRTHYEKKPFPHNITMAKGSLHILASRAYVEYVVKDPVALEFREWCRDTGHASEHFFNSLEYSPQLGVPGAYTGTPTEQMTVARWKEWAWYGYKCQGKLAHSICIIGVGDLAALYDTKFLFVNKLHAGYHPLAYSCLEELHFNRTRDDILGHRRFDVERYSQLPFVQDRLRVVYGDKMNQ